MKFSFVFLKNSILSLAESGTRSALWLGWIINQISYASTGIESSKMKMWKNRNIENQSSTFVER